MSTPQSYRTPCPPLRNAACLIVSLGCLLTAGSVLSSVAKPAPRPAPEALGAVPSLTSRPPVFYAMSCPIKGLEPGSHPLQALVCVEGGSLQITNTSADNWRDIRLEMGRGQHWRFAKLGPYETCLVPLKHLYNRPPACSMFRAPLPLAWRCRTQRGTGVWAGYVLL